MPPRARLPPSAASSHNRCSERIVATVTTPSETGQSVLENQLLQRLAEFQPTSLAQVPDWTYDHNKFEESIQTLVNLTIEAGGTDLHAIRNRVLDALVDGVTRCLMCAYGGHLSSSPPTQVTPQAAKELCKHKSLNISNHFSQAYFSKLGINLSAPNGSSDFLTLCKIIGDRTYVKLGELANIDVHQGA